MSMESLSAHKKTPRPCRKCGEVFSGARCISCWRNYCRLRRGDPEYLAAEKAAADRYYQRNREQVIASNPKRRMNDPERYQELARRSARNRRARKRSIAGGISKGLEERLYVLQRGMCPCCGQPLLDDFHMDHIVPLALGGAHADENMQLLRAKCNLQKHALHPVEFMQRKGFLL